MIEHSSTDIAAEEKKYLAFDIVIISGCYNSPECFDFSFADLKIIDIEKKEFLDYINEHSSDEEGYNTIHMLEPVKKEIWTEYIHTKRYAIIKNNPFNNFIRQDIWDAYAFILMLYPSDVQISEILHASAVDDKIESFGLSMYDRKYIGEFPGKPLQFSEKSAGEINSFIKLYFYRLRELPIAGLAYYHYRNSFLTDDDPFIFASLFTALDSIIDGVTDSIYKFRRGIAILLGADEHISKLVSNNLNVLYKYRNELFHGGNYPDYKKLQLYIPKMRSMVSRVLIELLVHGVGKDILNQKFTELGYGDRAKISKGWKMWELNVLTEIDIFTDFK